MNNTEKKNENKKYNQSIININLYNNYSFDFKIQN